MNPGDRKPGHDPESTVKRGMSTEASGVDAAETMASTGDEEAAFQEIVSGTATGLGIDRAETVGTGGLATGEDRDDVAVGVAWLEDQSGAPDESAERFDLEGERFGWQVGADLGKRAAGGPKEAERSAGSPDLPSETRGDEEGGDEER